MNNSLCRRGVGGGCQGGPGERLLADPADGVAGPASLRQVLPASLQVRVQPAPQAGGRQEGETRQPGLQRQGQVQGGQAAVHVAGEEEGQGSETEFLATERPSLSAENWSTPGETGQQGFVRVRGPESGGGVG